MIEKEIGPDLLADIILSLVKGVDGAEMAGWWAPPQEVLRQPPKSQCLQKAKPPDASRLTTSLACPPPTRPLIPSSSRRCGVVLSEDKLSIAHARRRRRLRDNPAVSGASLVAKGAVKSADFKARTRKLEVLPKTTRPASRRRSPEFVRARHL